MSHVPTSQTLPWLDWANLRYRLDWIYEGPINPKYRETREYIPGQSAFLIRDGSVEISSSEGNISAGPGEWLLLNEGLRNQKFSPDARMLSIRFHWTWPGGQPLFDWKLATHLASVEAPQLEEAAINLESCVQKNYAGAGVELGGTHCDLESHLDVQLVFMEWLRVYAKTLLHKGHSPSRFEVADSRVLRAIWILDRHPLNQPLPEVQLAHQVNLSLGQFGRLFSQQLGISPFRYLERRRLTEAVALVRGSQSSLKAIAIDLGFNSLSHFSSWFRRKTKRSPSDYRKT